MTLNYVFAVGVWLLFFIAALAVTLPRVRVVPMLVGSLAIMVAMPLLLAPVSKSIWASIEFLILRGSPEYLEPVRASDDRASELE